MLKWLARRRRFRSLKAMAARLPSLLSKSYGACGTYTTGQVVTGSRKLGLSPESTAAALAACCNQADFTALGGEHTTALYGQLRTEIGALFDIDSDTLSA